MRTLKLEEFAGKRVLEVGSKYVNGNIRPFVECFLHLREYIGIDIEPGKYVDLVIPVERSLEYFSVNKFDVVVLIATLEHIMDWRKRDVILRKIL